MKKIIILLLVFVLFGPPVIAANSQDAGQKGTQDDGIKAEDSEKGQGADQVQQVQTETEQQTQNRGEEENLMIQQRVQVEAQRLNEIKQTIQQKAKEMSQEIQQMKKTEQNVYQNQNEVRLAVHSLLTMEDVLGGIGQQVSQIATEFNNSVQATIKAEEAIQSRNRIVKFLVGGDEEAAEEIGQEINRNQERIQQLVELKEQCDCGEEVRTMLQEQIANMEQEQDRLQQLAQSEKQAKGIFGWVRNLFGLGT